MQKIDLIAQWKLQKKKKSVNELEDKQKVLNWEISEYLNSW